MGSDVEAAIPIPKRNTVIMGSDVGARATIPIPQRKILIIRGQHEQPIQARLRQLG